MPIVQLESLRLTRCAEFDILEIDAANLKCLTFFEHQSPFASRMPRYLEASLCGSTQVTSFGGSLTFLFQSYKVIPFTWHPWRSGTRRFMNRVLSHGRYTRESANCSMQCQISLYFGYVFQKYNVDEVSSTGYVITSCAKLQEVTIECGVVGIAVEPVIYTIITSLINLVQCCKAASKYGDALYYRFLRWKWNL